MSFAGGTGHRSPFAERAKTTKSHLSPRRSSAASGLGSHARTPQQSLFGKESTTGKDSQAGDSSAKAGQMRNAQTEIKEPTTPTRASEGSTVKGNRRDEFSSFNSRRVGTPIKTPRTAFGTIAPRSPKRPHMGSPKYQKVLLERPAFYNSPAVAGEDPAVPDAGRKEVSISELQKRLRRFLQDENVPSPCDHEVASSCEHLDEVPYNFSRSPRVNPLFHHDETVLHVTKGGVAFTAGVADNTVLNRPEGVAFTAVAAGNICTTRLQPVSLFNEGPDVSTPSPLRTCDVEKSASPNVPDVLDYVPSVADGAGPATDPTCDDCGALETEQPLRCEDFPVHSEVEEDGNQEEEEEEEEGKEEEEQQVKGGQAEEEECAADQGVVIQARSAFFAAADSINSDEMEVIELSIVDMAGLNSPIVELQESEGAVPNSEAHEVHEVAHVDDQQKLAVEPHLETKETDYICEDTEEEEGTEIILESWSQRFLKFVVLAVVVACVMGIMVLTSGSPGLIPESFHSTSPLRHLPVSSPVIPISIGFMGMGKEHEGMQCLPAVHLGLKYLSSSPYVGVSGHGGSSSSFRSQSYDASSVTKRAVGTVRSVESEELKTVTDYYRELQGKLYSDVVSLTSESALSDAVNAGTAMGAVSEVRVLDANIEDVITEVADIEYVPEVADNQVVEQLVAPADVTELVKEITEKLQLEETLPSSDEHSREESLQSSASRNLEGSQIIPEPSPEVDTQLLPADVELESSIPASHLSYDELHMAETTSIELSEPFSSTVKYPAPEEITSSVLIEESAFNDIPAESNEDTSLLIVSPIITEKLCTDTASPVQGADEEISCVNIDDLVDVEDHEQNLRNVHVEEPESQRAVEVAGHPELSCSNPESNVVASEEAGSENEEEWEVNGLYSMAAIVLLVVALAVSVPRFLKSQGAVPAVISAQPNADLLKPMSSPISWHPTRSGYDSHIPGKDELDAITSPLKSFRTQRPYGVNRFERRDNFSVEPASSAPGLFQPRARVEASRPATTWHPSMRAAGSNSVSTSGYRQTASYIPTIPSESAISTSTRGASDLDSVCESVLSMGAEEWEHLGSFTTTETVSVNEAVKLWQGGEEQKIRTPVRRSQRIRNRVSPLPVKFA